MIRACAMTLIVVVEEERDAQAIGETLAALMHEHPSRAIVLRVRSGNEPSLSARVFAQCWMPFGSRQQICCEQVEIISSLASFSDVTSVLRGLIVPDLPVVSVLPERDAMAVAGVRRFVATGVETDYRLRTECRNSPSALTYLNSLAVGERIAKSGSGLVAPHSMA